MRYKDWDVLLFDQNSHVPQQEFKVACQVVHDTESSTPQVSGVPAVTCFVSSLQPGTPFKISVHSWGRLPINQVVNNEECSAISIRLFIDGVSVTSIIINQSISWPCIISHTDQKQVIRFPIFQQELLCQRHWSAADNLGRIKLVIGEGICHGSQGGMAFERVHNHVIFSFQHAPQDVLEHMEIAWPNTSMWRRLQQASTPSLTDSSSDSKDQTTVPQQPFSFPGQTALEKYTTSPVTPSFQLNDLSADCPIDPTIATMSPLDHAVPSHNQDTTPHMSTIEMQLSKLDSEQLLAWPDSPMFGDATFALGQQPQQQVLQQMYTPSNGSVPMPLVQLQAQSSSMHELTELGQGTAAGSPARLLFGSPAHNAPQTLHSKTTKRPAKRVRAEKSGSAQPIKEEDDEHQNLDIPFNFNPVEVQIT